MSLNWKLIVRDACILLAVGLLGGVLVALTVPMGEQDHELFSSVGIISIFIGGVIVGYLYKQRTQQYFPDCIKHFAMVGGVFWLYESVGDIYTHDGELSLGLLVFVLVLSYFKITMNIVVSGWVGSLFARTRNAL